MNKSIHNLQLQTLKNGVTGDNEMEVFLTVDIIREMEEVTGKIENLVLLVMKLI